MKRLLALVALMLGLTALAAPAQARLHYEHGGAEITRVERPCNGGEAIRSEASEAKPRASRAKRNRELGAPAMRNPRTVLLPVIMLADRPLE